MAPVLFGTGEIGEGHQIGGEEHPLLPFIMLILKSKESRFRQLREG
jgi:hypothetical protein